MLGFHLLHYELLPPTSPEDHPREENHSEVGSVVIPLIEHQEGDNVRERFVLPAASDKKRTSILIGIIIILQMIIVLLSFFPVS